MAEPERKPRVILQTESFRILAKSKAPFEGKPRGDEITIEERFTNTLDEPYWHPTYHLWDGRSAMSKDEKLLLKLFQEVAAARGKPEIGLMLMELASRITNKVVIEPVMPFDARDGAIGIALTPGQVSMLARLYPGVNTTRAVVNLLEQAARELA